MGKKGGFDLLDTGGVQKRMLKASIPKSTKYQLRFQTVHWENKNNYKHSHKKRKDGLETRAILLIFSPELEIFGVAVQSIYQNSEK